ncbi:hypothetical protein TELCIR_00993 [Teladorsagia circumcincta]|uniref:Uncharacterized protein n=1 Tax=Teladorsagia circumcincta TaxID=45464 RepID=A0A2G9V3D2_TELCI|nr:hypothetical protein TELCIR_00993 [Teladorsagia circumcincta]
MHQALLTDHDRLQNLHDLLTQDYERARLENVDMKSKLKSQRPIAVSHSRELDEMRTALEHERTERDRQLRAYADLHNEQGALKRELDQIRKENDCLSRNCDGLGSEVRKLKLAEQAQRATVEDLMSTVEEQTKSIQAKELEIAKLHNAIELLTKVNRVYEEESKNLGRQVFSSILTAGLLKSQKDSTWDLLSSYFRLLCYSIVDLPSAAFSGIRLIVHGYYKFGKIQVETLLHYNRELQEKALSEKSVAHMEQKQFQDRLNALQRHKEKLEEKIMDQYRSMESKKLAERQKQPLVKRAAKALINRRRPSVPSGGSTTEDSSVYSADEGSPPLVNGKSLHKNRATPADTTAQITQTAPANTAAPPAPRVLARSAVYGIDDFDPFPPTCSSSEDHDRITPPHETICTPQEPICNDFVRFRGDAVGGSMRDYSPRRAPALDRISCSGPERSADGPMISALPPRAPIRNTAATASLRSRPPPPPYFSNGKQKPPPYPGRTSSEERLDKAMSIYENVQQAEVRANESTVWYEYGCV